MIFIFLTFPIQFFYVLRIIFEFDFFCTAAFTLEELLSSWHHFGFNSPPLCLKEVLDYNIRKCWIKMTVRGTMVRSEVCNSWCFCLGS